MHYTYRNILPTSHFFLLYIHTHFIPFQVSQPLFIELLSMLAQLPSFKCLTGKIKYETPASKLTVNSR